MINKLKMFIQNSIPTAYDDSLSYYESISKITNKQNEIIDFINLNIDETAKKLINNYLSNLFTDFIYNETNQNITFSFKEVS